jgi:hypothetical protein
MTALFLLLSLLGCEDKITVNLPSETTENSPPIIHMSGPEFDPNTPILGPIRKLWVVASDPDGEDDIAAVIFSIETIVLNSLIVRPDDAAEACRIVHYADMDTINIIPLLTTGTFTMHIPLYGSRGFYHTYYLDYHELTPNGLRSQSNVFGSRVKDRSCGGDYDLYLDQFGLYPPALPAARDVYVTRADFLLKNMAITVYDHSGATATAAFPDLEVYFTNHLEEQTLP